MGFSAWDNVAQAVIVAVCSWYVRRGSKTDSKASQSSLHEILRRLDALELDMGLVKRASVKDTGLMGSGTMPAPPDT